MRTQTIGMTIEDWYCHGMPGEPLSSEQRASVINFALGFEECQSTIAELAALTDQDLVRSAYWAMAEYARGQV